MGEGTRHECRFNISIGEDGGKGHLGDTGVDVMILKWILKETLVNRSR